MTHHAVERCLLALLSLTATSAVWAGGDLADILWSDSANSAYHQFTDVNHNGLYQNVDEISFFIDPSSEVSSPASPFDISHENGQKVIYWVPQNDDMILRGSDLNRDTLISGGEYTVFRDSGLLDGNSAPQDLEITDDGAVWWVSGLSSGAPQNGLSRLEDLNGDGDAADVGEQIVMVDGTGAHSVEHDAGSSTITAWAIRSLASAGNGVMGYVGLGYADDECVYRFEDLNGDGDVLDAGESVLLLNAAGESADLPQNPDFADGTLKNVLLLQGYYAGDD